MAIDTAITELNAAWQAASQDIYAQQQAQGGANANANAGAGASGAGAGAGAGSAAGDSSQPEDVEFEEVQATGRRQRAAGFGHQSEPLRFLCPLGTGLLPAAVCLVGCFGIVRLKCRSGRPDAISFAFGRRAACPSGRGVETCGVLRRAGRTPPPAADCRTTIRRSPSDELRPILASDAFRASSSGRRRRNWYSGGPAAECC